MDHFITALIKKTVYFKRLKSKNIKSYKIYTKTVDTNYTSGIKTELIDEIENPVIPSPVTSRKVLGYSPNFTWQLPDDIYIDQDHPFRILVNDIAISSLHYTLNRLTNLVTINTNIIKIDLNTVVEIEYFKDIIIKSYMVEKDCELIVEPIFRDTHNYGKHNVIV